mmetsp:Transcript_33670/g.71289  ORF Transcript_33670/g.71289 Transcript_33670/m.71289 type:complete len:1503 (+) Transcript_33670:38-4546(+)
MAADLPDSVYDVRDHIAKGLGASLHVQHQADISAHMTRHIVDCQRYPRFQDVYQEDQSFIVPLRDQVETDRVAQEAREAEARMQAEQAAVVRREIDIWISASTSVGVLLPEYLSQLQKDIGATGVYMGEVKQEGSPEEHIEYFAASRGHEFMVGEKLPKGSGKTWEVFGSPTLEEAEGAPKMPAGTWAPPPSATREPHDQGSVVVVRHVTDFDEVRFFRLPRPGQFVAVPVVFTTPADPAAVAAGAENLGASFRARQDFDEDVVRSAQSREDEKESKAKEKAAASKAKLKKAAKAKEKPKSKKKQEVVVEPEDDEDHVEPLDPERLFFQEDHLQPLPENRTVKWVLCVDTLGDDLRFPAQSEGASSGGSAEMDCDRRFSEAHIERVKEAASFIARQTRRQHVATMSRFRDLQFFQHRGLVSDMVKEQHEVRDSRISEIQPQEAAVDTNTASKSKKGGKKKAEKKVVGVEFSEEDKYKIMQVHVDICSKLQETLRWAVLAEADNPAPSQPVLDTVSALFTMLRYKKAQYCGPAGSIDWRKASRLVTSSLLHRLEHHCGLNDPRPLQIGELLQKAAVLKPDDLENESLAMSNLGHWIKHFTEAREYINKTWVRLQPVTELRVLVVPVPRGADDGEDDEGDATSDQMMAISRVDDFATDLANQDKRHVVEPLQMPLNGRDILPSDQPGADTRNPAIALLMAQSNVIDLCPFSLESDDEHIKMLVSESGHHLVVFGDPIADSIRFLNRAFGWTLEAAFAPDCESFVGFVPAHMFSLPMDRKPKKGVDPIGSSEPFVSLVLPRPVAPLCRSVTSSLPQGAVSVATSAVADCFLVEHGAGNVVVCGFDPSTAAGAQFLVAAASLQVSGQDSRASWAKLSELLQFPEGSNALGMDRVEAETGRLEGVSTDVAIPIKPTKSDYLNGLDGLWVHFDVSPNNGQVGNFIHTLLEGPATTNQSLQGRMTAATEVAAGWWGSVLTFSSSDAHCELGPLAARPIQPRMSRDEIALYRTLPNPEPVRCDDATGWTFAMWIRPTLKTTRNHQVLARFHCDGYLDCELRLSTNEKVVLWSSEDNPRPEGGPGPDTPYDDWTVDGVSSAPPVPLEGEEELEETEEVRERAWIARSGETRSWIRFGDWNFIAVQQVGLTRRLWLNGVEETPCQHSIGAPSQLDASKFPGNAAGDQFAVHPPTVVILSPPATEERPSMGPFDKEPGTGSNGFRGSVGEAYFWSRPVGDHVLTGLFTDSRASNMWHPRAESLASVSIIDAENSGATIARVLGSQPGFFVRGLQELSVAAVERTELPGTPVVVAPAGGNWEPDEAVARALREYVHRGNTFVACIHGDERECLPRLNRMFCWNLQEDSLHATSMDAPRNEGGGLGYYSQETKEAYLEAHAELFETGPKPVMVPSLRGGDHPWSHYFGSCPEKVDRRTEPGPDGSVCSVSWKSLPAQTTVLYSGNLSDAWTVDVGEGRVSFLGNYNLDGDEKWSNVARAVLHGQSAFDFGFQQGG